MNAIEARGLSKKYSGFQLRDVSFTLPEGSIMGLVGENGAGKSTLIRLIMGAAAADSGQVTVLGTQTVSPKFIKAKDDIGVVLDEAHFPVSLNAAQIGRIMGDTYSRWDQGEYARLLQRLDLPEKKTIKNFSRGMTMKLALATALSHDARLLVLDEPTGGLDPMVRDEILDILEDFTRREDRSVLISSHIVSDLEKLCDYIAFLHKGELLLFEEKDRLLEEYGVVKLSEADFEAVPKAAVKGARRGKYGVEALVDKSVAGSVRAEKPTLEDVIIFFARGNRE